jgi:hypothetical protein
VTNLSELKLSKVEKKILAAASECGQNRMTAEAIADLAGCSSALVCKKLQRPEFRQLFVECVQTSLVVETPAILHTFTNAAKEGSFKHGKLVLEMAGVYQEKQKVEIGGKVEVGDSPFKTDEEKASFLTATVAEYLKKTAESTGGDVS